MYCPKSSVTAPWTDLIDFVGNVGGKKEIEKRCLMRREEDNSTRISIWNSFISKLLACVKPFMKHEQSYSQKMAKNNLNEKWSGNMEKWMIL